jgi:spore coat protein A
MVYLSEPVAPEASESGWKDTVRVTPGASTRIIVNFSGYAGRYVWHCHILEHEDNEMMRPYEVLPG